MIIDALIKVWKFILYRIIETILKILYLSLPLWVHMFILQMREKVDTLPSINGYLKEDSTWAMIYDGVAMVNTKPGELRAKASEFRAWVIRKKATWITLAVIFYLMMFAYIGWRIIVRH